jgi:hypothetical protein
LDELKKEFAMINTQLESLDKTLAVFTEPHLAAPTEARRATASNSD